MLEIGAGKRERELAVAGLASRRSLDWSTHSWAVLKYGISGSPDETGDALVCDYQLTAIGWFKMFSAKGAGGLGWAIIEWL